MTIYRQLRRAFAHGVDLSGTGFLLVITSLAINVAAVYHFSQEQHSIGKIDHAVIPSQDPLDTSSLQGVLDELNAETAMRVSQSLARARMAKREYGDEVPASVGNAYLDAAAALAELAPKPKLDRNIELELRRLAEMYRVELAELNADLNSRNDSPRVRETSSQSSDVNSRLIELRYYRLQQLAEAMRERLEYASSLYRQNVPLRSAAKQDD